MALGLCQHERVIHCNAASSRPKAKLWSCLCVPKREVSPHPVHVHSAMDGIFMTLLRSLGHSVRNCLHERVSRPSKVVLTRAEQTELKS